MAICIYMYNNMRMWMKWIKGNPLLIKYFISIVNLDFRKAFRIPFMIFLWIRSLRELQVAHWTTCDISINEEKRSLIFCCYTITLSVWYIYANSFYQLFGCHRRHSFQNCWWCKIRELFSMLKYKIGIWKLKYHRTLYWNKYI